MIDINILYDCFRFEPCRGEPNGIDKQRKPQQNKRQKNEDEQKIGRKRKMEANSSLALQMKWYLSKFFANDYVESKTVVITWADDDDDDIVVHSEQRD